MVNNNIDRKSCCNLRQHHQKILLTAAILFFIPSPVCGQTRSTTGLVDAYRKLTQVIERETLELEELKLNGASQERIAEARHSAELAQQIDSGLAELEKIRAEKTRLLEKFQQTDLSNQQSSDQVGGSNPAPAFPKTAGPPSAQAAASPLQKRLPASLVDLNAARWTTSAKRLGKPASPIAGIQARFRLPCGCRGEIHFHNDSAVPRFCWHHHHRKAKMTTQTLPEFTGKIPATWVPVVVLADGKTTVFRDSRNRRYLVHRR